MRRGGHSVAQLDLLSGCADVTPLQEPHKPPALTLQDYERAGTNPWGFTPRQCQVLAMVCACGGVKAAADATGESVRTLNGVLATARRGCGRTGSDLRLYLDWHQWVARGTPCR
jgi:hypothetical protein